MRLLPRSLRDLVLVVVSFAPVGSGFALAAEFQINDQTAGDQEYPSVATSADGAFVVVWRRAGDDNQILGQRFDSAGAPLGGEFQINAATTTLVGRAAVATDTGGGFVVVWNQGDTLALDLGDVVGQRFDSSGSPLGGEFQVGSLVRAYPSVATDPDGGFVVVGWSFITVPIVSAIFAQRFDSAGAPVGAEFQVNTYNPVSLGGGNTHPAVAAAADGAFVVVWSSLQDGGFWGVFGRRFDSAGSPLGGEFQINTYTTAFQGRSEVAIDPAGASVVVWASVGQDGDAEGIIGQRFDSAGGPVGGEFQVSTYTMNSQNYPAVAADTDGGFVVVWASDQDGDSSGIFGQRFDSTGAPVGGEFQINDYVSSTQFAAKVAANAAGEFVVAWSSYGQDGDGYGIFGARFPDPCGNETVDTGEDCDDGTDNGTNRSCCDANCRYKANGNASCDGNPCTRSDICTDGVCTPGPCADSHPCTICGGICDDGGGGCECLL